jgi:transcription elongation factor GreB
MQGPELPDYITPEGHKKLVEEYDFLNRKERPEVTRQVSRAAAMGDRSENAEYIYGKKRLREIDRRLRYLRKRLGGVTVINPEEFEGPVIRFGAYVLVEDQDGKESTYRIVGRDEIDAKAGHISYQSPVGRALVGKREGDEVKLKTPSGARVLEVVEVHYIERT